jgi:hypothetical protein
MSSRNRKLGGSADGARRWVRRVRSTSPLVVLSLACGLGLYWVATQIGWLAAGWGPAMATTILYLAGLAAIMGAMTGAGALGQRLLDQAFPASRHKVCASRTPLVLGPARSTGTAVTASRDRRAGASTSATGVAAGTAARLVPAAPV